MLTVFIVIALVVVIIAIWFTAGRGQSGFDVGRDGEDPHCMKVVVVLPGILQRGYEQVAPIRDALDPDSNLLVVDYKGEYFNAKFLAKEIAKLVDNEIDAGRKVELFGVSIGGVLTTSTVQKLVKPTDKLTVTIVDAPAGAKTLSDVPSLFARPIGWLFRHTQPGKLFSRFPGKLIINLMSVPPKWDNIEAPSDMNEDAISGYKEQVIKDANAGLKGHKFSMWWSQLAYMSQSNVPYRALDDVPVTYFACVSTKQDTVRQPDASKVWKASVRGEFAQVNVDTAHAAFLEAEPTWSNALMHR